MSGLVINDLAKRFGDVVAVDGLSLHVPRGGLIGFLGPNGAGKTTTMRAVMGMVQHDRGSISWNGNQLTDADRSRFGYMPQERGLYARMKVREQVAYFASLAGLSKTQAGTKTDEWLERLGLADHHGSLVQELSGGNQQRVQLAVSMVHDPDLLVLDEPFAGLDPVAAETMRDIIDERAADGVSVLFSSHQLDLVEELCEQVVIVANGKKLAAGAISDLRSASPTRWLNVRWRDAVEQWTPTLGRLDTFDGLSAAVELSDQDDVGDIVADAAAVGSVTEVRVEPPGLDDVFAELVADGNRTRPDHLDGSEA